MFKDPENSFVAKKIMDKNKSYDSVTMNVNPIDIFKAMESAHILNYSNMLNTTNISLNEMPSIVIKDNSNERMLQTRIIVDKKKQFNGKL